VRRNAASALLFVLCAALLLSVGPGVPTAFAGKNGKEPGRYRLVPGPYDKKRVADEGAPAASQTTLKGLTVMVEPLEPEDRAAFIERIKPGMADPFAPAPGRPEQFMVFRVAFDNRTGFPVTFQPGNVMIITKRQAHRFPLDFTDLYLNAERAGIDDPQRATNRVVALIYDTSTTIPDGTRMERLLVFRPLTDDDKWREFGMHFSYIQIDSDTHTLSFMYHKQLIED
jgi:hypothetical protein